MVSMTYHGRHWVIIERGLPWWAHLLYAIATICTCGLALWVWVVHAWYAHKTGYRVYRRPY